MIKLKSILLYILFSLHIPVIFSTTYYIDSQSGNDSNSGKNMDLAWKNLSKVNSSKFIPGDTILFKRNSVFSGQLELRLEGTNQDLIIVGAYGKGNKPQLNGEGEKQYTLLLENSAYCVVQDLEITNTGGERKNRRVGVLILAENSGDRHQITIQNLTVKNVNGSLVKKDGSGGGIYWDNKGDSIKTRFIDLKILDCHVKDCGRNGIYSGGYSSRDNWYPSLGVLIKGNLLEGVPGDGIVPIGCDGAVIEYNVMKDCPDILSPDEAAAGIWPWSCDNTIIQYNEVSGHNAKWDGQGFDSDYNCRNTIIQYNYSHNNAGGFLLVCNDGDSLGKNWNIGTDNTIVRYNVSVNDGLRAYPTKQVGWFSPVIHITGPVTNTQFYGNLIVVKKKGSPEIDKSILKMDDWGKKWADNTRFYNNIFYVEDDAQTIFKFGGDTQTLFQGNTYIGDIENKPKDTQRSSTKVEEVQRVLQAKDINQMIFELKSLNKSSDMKKHKAFEPGKIWTDTDGVHINAHGGGILYHNNKYYWFGEHKGKDSNNALVGVMCYSSDDLYNWTNEGVALSVVENDEKSPITKGCIIERPKVVYNEKTKQFVMFFHLELKGKGYESAHVGIATSDKPTGPFQFVKSYRPNAGYYPIDMSEKQKNQKVTPDNFPKWWTKEWTVAVKDGLFVRRDFQGGQMSRDMTVYVDDDGKAYHIYSSEENLTLQIAELSDDYLSHTGKYTRVEPAGHNEAPAIFKKDGHYFMITSGCTGWAPNAARLLVADNIWGPWKLYPNPCVGKDSELTFHSQSTYILPVEGKKDAFIFMADRWTPKDPIDGRYVWLPIQFENNMPVLKWLDNWTLGIFNK